MYIEKEWGEEDTIAISFPMRAKLMAAAPAVREDIGKAALVRGPIVYCIEEADNGKDLHLLSIKTDTTFEVTEETIQGTLVRKIRAQGYRTILSQQQGRLYYPLETKVEKQEVSITYVPYYTWANRGENEMQVWVVAASDKGDRNDF